MSETKKSAWAEICDYKHKLHRILNIDRTSFFGRLEIIDYYCEDLHQQAGERWRKFGRYGNILSPMLFKQALQMCHDEAQFTIGEISEVRNWFFGQGTPDQCCAYGLMDVWVPEIWGAPIVDPRKV